MSQIKDKKISIYYIKTDRDSSGNEIKTKQYIHSQKRLWAYVKELFSNDNFSAKSEGATTTTMFKVCFNKKICASQYLEFNGETYLIQSVSQKEFYNRDLMILAKRCTKEETTREEFDQS